MMKIKDGRYRIAERWHTDVTCRFAQALDTHTGNQVVISEFMNHRYPIDPQDRPVLLEVGRRTDRFAAYARRVVETAAQAGECSGSISRVIDFFREGASLYLVREYVDALPLETADVYRRMSPAEIDMLVLKIAHALKELHQRGLLYGDIQPESILIRKDQGAVEPVLRVEADRAMFKGDLPGGMDIVATPEYMSPELALHKFNGETSAEITEAADLFSLGMVYHQCLSGELPSFDEEKYGTLWEVMCADKKCSKWALSERLDEPHRRLMEALLQPEAKNRLQSCDELIERIKAVISECEKDEAYHCSVDEKLIPADEDADDEEQLWERESEIDAGWLAGSDLERAYDRLREELLKMEPGRRLQSCTYLIECIGALMEMSCETE